MWISQIILRQYSNCWNDCQHEGRSGQHRVCCHRRWLQGVTSLSCGVSSSVERKQTAAARAVQNKSPPLRNWSTESVGDRLNPANWRHWTTATTCVPWLNDDQVIHRQLRCHSTNSLSPPTAKENQLHHEARTEAGVRPTQWHYITASPSNLRRNSTAEKISMQSVWHFSMCIRIRSNTDYTVLSRHYVKLMF